MSLMTLKKIMWIRKLKNVDKKKALFNIKNSLFTFFLNLKKKIIRKEITQVKRTCSIEEVEN